MAELEVGEADIFLWPITPTLSVGISTWTLREIQFHAELDVGRLMLSGCSSKQIARKLEISVQTVKVHKQHNYRKLGITSQSDLISIFLQAQKEKEGTCSRSFKRSKEREASSLLL